MGQNLWMHDLASLIVVQEICHRSPLAWWGERLEMHIDCDQCAMKNTNTCDDCVVTVLFRLGPVDLTEQEVAALDNLAEEGLVPRLRLVPANRRVS